MTGSFHIRRFGVANFACKLSDAAGRDHQWPRPAIA